MDTPNPSLTLDCSPILELQWMSLNEQSVCGFLYGLLLSPNVPSEGYCVIPVYTEETG